SLLSRFLLTCRRRPRPTLFPYTTLFRSKALQGNLCRCTGYAPIIRAGKAMSSYGLPQGDPLLAERIALKDKIKAIHDGRRVELGDRKSTRLNSSHVKISYAVFCLKKKKK